MLAGIEILNHNWFRRERFKVEMWGKKKENELNFKKIARDLGIQNTKAPPEPPEKTKGANLISAVLPELIKNMEPETLASIATNLIGGYGGEVPSDIEGGGGSGDFLSDIIANNPDLVKSFLEGFKGGKKQENTGTNDFIAQM